MLGVIRAEVPPILPVWLCDRRHQELLKVPQWLAYNGWQTCRSRIESEGDTIVRESRARNVEVLHSRPYASSVPLVLAQYLCVPNAPGHRTKPRSRPVFLSILAREPTKALVAGITQRLTGHSLKHGLSQTLPPRQLRTRAETQAPC